MYAGTDLCTHHPCIQFCARELPVRARVYVDCVHHVCDYVVYVNIFLVLYYLTLYYIIKI